MMIRFIFFPQLLFPSIWNCSRPGWTRLGVTLGIITGQFLGLCTLRGSNSFPISQQNDKFRFLEYRDKTEILGARLCLFVPNFRWEFLVGHSALTAVRSLRQKYK